MPNLIRAPSMPSVPSIPSLASPVNPPSHSPSSLPTISSSMRNSQSFDSSTGLARLQSSSKTLSLMSMNESAFQGSFLFMVCYRALFFCRHGTFKCSTIIIVTEVRVTLLPCVSVPSPGQLSQRVQSMANFPTMPRHPLKATAYVSPTVQQGPASTPLTTSASLHSIPSSIALPQPLKPSNSLVPQPLKVGANQPAVHRSSLPRPASFVGTSGVPRPSKITPPTRR